MGSAESSNCVGTVEALTELDHHDRFVIQLYKTVMRLSCMFHNMITIAKYFWPDCGNMYIYTASGPILQYV